MKVLAVDPGETTGYVLLDTDLTMPVEEYGEEKKEDFFTVLNRLAVSALHTSAEIDKVIVENYLVRPRGTGGKFYNHDWSDVKTAKMIGSIEHWCWYYNLDMILQEPTIKPVGYGWLGLPNKHKHWTDALVHGCYWLIKNGHMDRGKINLDRTK